MKTPFDLTSVVLFAIIAVVFLHRSSKPEHDPVPLWAYAATAIACAIGDILANRGYTVPGALLLLAAIAGGAWITLKQPAGPDSKI